jgi:hypothetical protein
MARFMLTVRAVAAIGGAIDMDVRASLRIPAVA